MAQRDPYALAVAFDDVYSEPTPAAVPIGPAPMRLLCALAMILARLRARQLKTPAFDVTPAAGGAQSFALPPAPAAVPWKAPPLYRAILERFERATPGPKLVRLDDAEGYVAFRRQRQKPYVRELAARVTALEDAMAAHEERDNDYFDDFDRHVSDGHGGDLDVLGEQVVEAASRAQRGGGRVPVALPKWTTGKVACWQDGPEALCTIRVADGRFVTTGTRLIDHVEQVIDCCLDLAPEESRPLAGPVAVRLAGESIVRQTAAIAPEVLRTAGNARSFVGIATPRCDAPKAALMALVQRCQRGDERALEEITDMAQAGASEHVEDAATRLLAAQADKAKGGQCGGQKRA